MKAFLSSLLLVGLLVLLSPVQAFANEAEAGSAEEGGGAPTATLAPLSPLAVPILQGNRVVKYVVITISLELAPEADLKEVELYMPRVMDASVMETYLFAKENAGAQHIDLEAYRARLLQVIQAVLGEGKITGLYFTGTGSVSG